METHVTFECGDIEIEGLASLPGGGCAHAAVLCHPHPLYGGSMHDNVVQALVDELGALGLGTLRFNFRGVGMSGGAHGGGEAECEDVAAAVSFIERRGGAERVSLVGYSFGAAVGMRAVRDDPRVDRIAGVSLPVAMMDGEFLVGCEKPKLLVSGDRDEYCPPGAIEDLFARLAEPRALEIVPGVDHFWVSHAGAAARTVGRWLTG